MHAQSTDPCPAIIAGQQRSRRQQSCCVLSLPHPDCNLHMSCTLSTHLVGRFLERPRSDPEHMTENVTRHVPENALKTPVNFSKRFVCGITAQSKLGTLAQNKIRTKNVVVKFAEDLFSGDVFNCLMVAPDALGSRIPPPLEQTYVLQDPPHLQ